MIAKNAPYTIVFDLVKIDGTAAADVAVTCFVAQNDGDFDHSSTGPVCKQLPVVINQPSHCYHLALTAEEMNADVVTVIATAEGCVPRTVIIYPESAWTAARAANVDNLDAAITSRLASADYTAPDNATIADAASEATAAKLAAIGAKAFADAVKAQTDRIRFSGETGEEKVLADAGNDEIAAAVVESIDLSGLALENTLRTVLSAVEVLGTGIEGADWHYPVTMAGVPLAGAWVEVFTDAARTQRCRQGLTRADGIVTFRMPQTRRRYYLSVHVPGREVFYDEEDAP